MSDDTIQKIADEMRDVLNDMRPISPCLTEQMERLVERLLHLSAGASGGGELARIGELIRTQDNRITDSPIFIVQQKRKICGIDADYTNNFEWLDPRDTSEVYDDAAKAAKDAEREEEGLPPINWIQGGYIEIWEFVTACFTEQGCKDYLARDGHNLKEPRIYAAGSYRNEEWRTVRKFLMGLAPASPATGHGSNECAWCFGDGILHDADIKCPRCGGSGKESTK